MAQLLTRYDTNPTGHDYVVGDIHGQFSTLEALLTHIGFDSQRDRLFSMGDLIDRGPESNRAVEFLEAPWFHAILGNHEVMLLESAYTVTGLPDANENAALWCFNGGTWFFDLPLLEQQTIYQAINRLPLAIEVALPNGHAAGLAHASVGRNTAGERHWSRVRATPEATFDPGELEQVSDLVWDRDLAYTAMRRATRNADDDITIGGIDLVFFGHTPLQTPIRIDNTRWLDTGAGHGKTLSVAELAVEGQVWSMATSDQNVTAGWTP